MCSRSTRIYNTGCVHWLHKPERSFSLWILCLILATQCTSCNREQRTKSLLASVLDMDRQWLEVFLCTSLAFLSLRRSIHFLLRELTQPPGRVLNLVPCCGLLVGLAGFGLSPSICLGETFGSSGSARRATPVYRPAAQQ